MTLDAAIGVRECRACHQTMPLVDFPFRSVDAQTRQWICLECLRQYSREWYALNRSKHIARVGSNRVVARRRAAAFVAAHLTEHPCVDCGEADLRVLDFDHLRDKTAEISRLINAGATNERLRAEIAKCEVRCANCHRRRTMRMIGGYRLQA